MPQASPVAGGSRARPESLQVIRRGAPCPCCAANLLSTVRRSTGHHAPATHAGSELLTVGAQDVMTPSGSRPCTISYPHDNASGACHMTRQRTIEASACQHDTLRAFVVIVIERPFTPPTTSTLILVANAPHPYASRRIGPHRATWSGGATCHPVEECRWERQRRIRRWNREGTRSRRGVWSCALPCGERPHHTSWLMRTCPRAGAGGLWPSGPDRWRSRPSPGHHPGAPGRPRG